MQKGALGQKERAGNLDGVQHMIKRADHMLCGLGCHLVSVSMNNNAFSPFSLAFNFFFLN